jgi:DNA-binding transcriptional MerR regulator
MIKDEGALKTIGEVSQDTGIPAHILRYWERNVPALKPLRRAGGRRYYRRADVDLVCALQRLVAEQGYTLEGAARAAASQPEPVQRRQIHSARDDSGGAISLTALRMLRDRLKAALDA